MNCPLLPQPVPGRQGERLCLRLVEHAAFMWMLIARPGQENSSVRLPFQTSHRVPRTPSRLQCSRKSRLPLGSQAAVLHLPALCTALDFRVKLTVLNSSRTAGTPACSARTVRVDWPPGAPASPCLLFICPAVEQTVPCSCYF